MYVDKNLIIGGVVEAYDTFATLDFEKDVIIRDYDLDAGTSTDFTAKALQLNKDVIKVSPEYQFLTEAHPVIFFKEDNLSGHTPDHTQRIGKVEDGDREYTIHSINKIFNFYVVRLKP